MRYILIALFLWSSSFVAGKYTYTMLDPVLMVQLRLLIATVIVLPMFMRVWKRVPKEVRPQVWWLGFLNYPARVGAFLGGAYWAFFLWRQSPNPSLDFWFDRISRSGHVDFWWRRNGQYQPFRLQFSVTCRRGICFVLALDAKGYRTINRASLYHQQHCVWHDNLHSFHPLAYRKLANSLELARCCRFALYWYRLQLVGVLFVEQGD